MKKDEKSKNRVVNRRGPSRDEHGFTKTQRYIIDVLGDGEWHPRTQLQRAIDDDDINTLNNHLVCIRKLLMTKGYYLTRIVSPVGVFGYQITRKVQTLDF